MCFNAPSSLTVFVIAIAIAITLWVRNKGYDRWNAMFVAVLSLIQLLEAGIWLWGKPASGGNNTNKILTVLIMVALLSQTVVQTFAGWKYSKSKHSFHLFHLMIIYIMVIGIQLVINYPYTSFGSTVGKSGRLEWGGQHDGAGVLGGAAPLYLAGIALPLLYMGYIKNGKPQPTDAPFWPTTTPIPLLAVAIITAGIAFAITGLNGGFSSMWCFLGIGYGLVALAM